MLNRLFYVFFVLNSCTENPDERQEEVQAETFEVETAGTDIDCGLCVISYREADVDTAV